MLRFSVALKKQKDTVELHHSWILSIVHENRTRNWLEFHTKTDLRSLLLCVLENKVQCGTPQAKKWHMNNWCTSEFSKYNQIYIWKTGQNMQRSV